MKSDKNRLFRCGFEFTFIGLSASEIELGSLYKKPNCKVIKDPLDLEAVYALKI